MDNYFKTCPPKVEDGGRFVSDYKTSTRRDEYIKFINGITRDDEYRLFLQKNGEVFMDREWEYYRLQNSCHPGDCVHIYPTRQSPIDMATERKVYDSRFSKDNTKYAKMRVCTQYADYRLN